MKQHFLYIVLAVSLSSMALQARLLDPSDFNNRRNRWRELQRESASKSKDEAYQELKDQFVKTCKAAGKVLLPSIEHAFINDKAYHGLEKEWEKLTRVLELYQFCKRL